MALAQRSRSPGAQPVAGHDVARFEEEAFHFVNGADADAGGFVDDACFVVLDYVGADAGADGGGHGGGHGGGMGLGVERSRFYLKRVYTVRFLW